MIYLWQNNRPSKKVHIFNCRTMTAYCKTENNDRWAARRLNARGEHPPADREVCKICINHLYV